MGSLEGTARRNMSLHFCWQCVIREQSHGSGVLQEQFESIFPELFWFKTMPSLKLPGYFTIQTVSLMFL